MGYLAGWRQRAKDLKADIFALYLAARDPRVPWYAKAMGLVVTAYAFSPIDLIPDFVPVVGYLDDFVLLPPPWRGRPGQQRPCSPCER
jgi:uncharacterized membrane protein YkvA (DUF1232 family)